MSKLTLVIGNKNYSSWSLRPWLFLCHHGIVFDEIRIPLYQPDSKARILERSPSGRVPCLIHGAARVWESLAICEYAAETLRLPGAWPEDDAAHAHARSIACEMHAGFAALRKEMPMDCRRAPASKSVSAEAQADIARVQAIWRECRSRFGAGGPWLFGAFGIADAMFAPVAIRFRGYAVPLAGGVREYVETVLEHPGMRDWMDAGVREKEVISF